MRIGGGLEEDWRTGGGLEEEEIILRKFCVLRLGLNSVHFTSLMTHLGEVDLQTPHSLSVACLSLVLRAAHTNQCDCYSSGRPHSLLFQVIRRPAAPIVLCRPRAPTGLELGPFHQSDDTPRRSSLSAYPAIRSTRRFSRQQRFVVVARLLTLALCAFMAAGAGVGGWAPKFFPSGLLR